MRKCCYALHPPLSMPGIVGFPCYSARPASKVIAIEGGTIEVQDSSVVGSEVTIVANVVRKMLPARFISCTLHLAVVVEDSISVTIDVTGRWRRLNIADAEYGMQYLLMQHRVPHKVLIGARSKWSPAVNVCSSPPCTPSGSWAATRGIDAGH